MKCVKKRCKPHIARKLEKFIPAKLGGDNRKSFVGRQRSNWAQDDCGGIRGSEQDMNSVNYVGSTGMLQKQKG